jgi:hypothetical protein
VTEENRRNVVPQEEGGSSRRDSTESDRGGGAARQGETSRFGRPADAPARPLVATYGSHSPILHSETGNISATFGNGVPLPSPTPVLPRCAILFLGVNPRDSTRLRLDEEVREIDRALHRGAWGSRVLLHQGWAVELQDLQTLLLRHQPTIVHFSGHGERQGLHFEDAGGKARLLSGEALAELFGQFPSIRCVVLNACSSAEQALAIASRIDVVIGMAAELGDTAARLFSTAFYETVASGLDVRKAFELGRIRLGLERSPDKETLRLIALRRPAEEIRLVEGD